LAKIKKHTINNTVMDEYLIIMHAMPCPWMEIAGTGILLTDQAASQSRMG
jgi:hypothetical protein